MTEKITTVPRSPSTLATEARPLWKTVCRHIIESESGLAPSQLPLIEGYCSAVVRARALRAASDEMDPRTKEGMDVARLSMAAERQVSQLAGDLKITPRTLAAKSAGPKGGRAPGTGTGALRQKDKTGTDGGAAVHWLDRARTGS